jgi:hypothetical protein
MSASTKTAYKSPAGTVYSDALTVQVFKVANQLLALDKFGGEVEPMTVTQGSYRPWTSYSGPTHRGCAAMDITAWNWENRLIILDLLGITGCHRTRAQGNWPEHIHAMTRGMGCADPYLKVQIEEVENGGDGLKGSRPDPDLHYRSGLWSLAVYQGRTGNLVAESKTNLRDGPSYDRTILRPAPVGTKVKAIMEVNVDGDRWFVTDKGEWGFSGKWERVVATTPIVYPADLFGKAWKATIPFDDGDSDPYAEEVKQPALATYSSPALQCAADGSVLFTVHHGAPTTSGSKNPRSELREMVSNGSTEYNWDGRSGEHSMEVELAITRLTPVRPHLVVAQIHGAGDDLTVLRAEGVKVDGKLTDRIKMWITNGDNTHGKYLGEIKLNDRFKFSFIVKNGYVYYGWKGRWVSDYKVKATDKCYFKTGAYLQSNKDTAPGESTKSSAQVRMFTKPKVSHAA